MSAYYITPEPLWLNEGFRRLLAWSVGAHCLLLLLGFIDAAPWSSKPAPTAVFVDLVAAAPEPAPAARRSRQVVDEAVVIPKRPKKQVKKKPPEKPKPEPKAEPGPSAEELLAQIRERQSARSVVAEIRSEHADGRPAAAGRVDPEVARYVARIRGCVYQSWSGAREFSRRPGLEVHFYLDIDPSGRVLRVELVRGSGNRYLDESAERAIWKCQPFPPLPPQQGKFRIVFDPAEAV